MSEESRKGAEENTRKKTVPLWQKPRREWSKEERRARMAKASAARRKAADKRDLSPLQSRFLVEVCTNGGNPGAAARAIGVDPTTGKRWMRLPQVAEAFQHYRTQAEGKLKDWGLLIDRAQETLVDLLDSKDDRVRLGAVGMIMDRGLGKVAAKVEATVTHQEALTGVTLEAALSLVAGAGMTLAEASLYVREHPEEVAAWAMANAPRPRRTLPPGEVVDVEILDNES